MEPSDSELDAYFVSRLERSDKRSVLWETLCRHVFDDWITESSVVLEIGAGWCDFINHCRGKRKIAVDLWSGFASHALPEVETYVAAADDISVLDSDTVDTVFASNLVEHLTQAEFKSMLDECSRVLKKQGRLILVQPNYRLCSKRYFDDYTHVSIWSDVSLGDFLSAHGWRVCHIRPRFLPLTVKSRFPVWPLLIRAYIRSPLKAFAGQMLIVAEPQN